MNTKTALLDCAEAATRARGFDGFSYADLADAVGIRKASIHHHFPKKADLALGLIERYSANLFASLDCIESTKRTAGEQLRSYVSIYRAALDDGHKLCLCVAFCTGRDGLSEPVVARLNDVHATITVWLTKVFAAGVADGSIASVTNPEIEAHACLAQVEGAQLIARAAADVRRFDSAIAGLLNRIEPTTGPDCSS